ncbi:hypothetical protein SDC9_122680 [bioreactor metagenome]|uniref:Uncharacterized protein n=1 Tax=bioreactor metagenome TaxID=1076179 RepID=A0A645CFD6_9ZZZZ
MVFGIQDLVRNVFLTQHLRKQFRGFHGYGTDKDRLTFRVTLFDVADDSPEFALQGWIQQIRIVMTDDRSVCRNRNDVHVIDFPELFFFRFRCTGHTGQFFVHTEIVLESDGGHRFRFIFDFHVLFRFDGLVKPVRVTAAFHDSSCELIDDFYLPVFHYVIDVHKHDVIRAQGLIQMVHQAGIIHIVQVRQMECFFGFLDAFIRQCD